MGPAQRSARRDPGPPIASRSAGPGQVASAGVGPDLDSDQWLAAQTSW